MMWCQHPQLLENGVSQHNFIQCKRNEERLKRRAIYCWIKEKNGTSFYCKKLIAISIRRNLDGVKNGMDIAYGAWEPLIAKGLQSYVKKK